MPTNRMSRARVVPSPGYNPEVMPESREAVARRTRTGPVPGGGWQVPCGAVLDTEVEAGFHYLTCDPCDLAHKERKFRAG